MYWQKSVTVPQNTLITAPLTEAFPVQRGETRRLYIDIPGGVCRLAGVAIYYQTVRLFPLPDGQYFRGDGVFFNTVFKVALTEDNPEVRLSLINFDSYYEHTITVGIDIEDAAAVDPLKIIADQFRKFI